MMSAFLRGESPIWLWCCEDEVVMVGGRRRKPRRSAKLTGSHRHGGRISLLRQQSGLVVTEAVADLDL